MTDSHRRAFLGYCAFAGISSAAFPLALLAQIKPGTTTIAAGTIREAARLAGLDWSDADCQDVAEQLSSLAASVQRIEKDSLTNASPLPLHFDPRPPGIATALPAGARATPGRAARAAPGPARRRRLLARHTSGRARPLEAGDVRGAHPDVPGPPDAPQRRAQLRGDADGGARTGGSRGGRCGRQAPGASAGRCTECHTA